MTVAEGCQALRVMRKVDSLQWGRNLTVAEGKAYALSESNRTALQWGRNLTVAEGMPMHKGKRRRKSGFNGAAT